MIDILELEKDKTRWSRYVAQRLQGDESLLKKILTTNKELKSARMDYQILKQSRNKIAQNRELDKKELARELKDKSKITKTLISQLEKYRNDLVSQLPNEVHPSVNHKGYYLVFQSHDKMEEKFGKTHGQIANQQNNIDLSRASKMSMPKFPLLKGDMAKLHRALSAYMLSFNAERGYLEYYLPYMVNHDAAFNTGQIPSLVQEMYSVQNVIRNEELFLIPTGEIPLINLYAHTKIKSSDLPIKATAHTPCFRREAGAHGKAAQGLKRQHQFDKVEIVELAHPHNIDQSFNQMIKHVSDLLMSLNLPFRVINLGYDDLGFASSRTYDFEVWMPISKEFMEISSCSDCNSFQTRRMSCKVAETKDFIFTLNGSSLAVGRTLIAILENHQEDGKIMIPQVLKPYLTFDRIKISSITTDQ